MEKRYGALRIIATVYKIIGVIWGILVIIGAVLVFIGGGSLMNFGFNSSAATMFGTVFASLVTLIFGLLGALAIYGVGELVYLLINIEENTRYSAIVLRDRLAAPLTSAQQQMMPPQPPV